MAQQVPLPVRERSVLFLRCLGVAGEDGLGRAGKGSGWTGQGSGGMRKEGMSVEDG